jgi:hypothetical protein
MHVRRYLLVLDMDLLAIDERLDLEPVDKGPRAGLSRAYRIDLVT